TSALARLISGELPLAQWVALVRATVPPPARWRRRRPGVWRRMLERARLLLRRVAETGPTDPPIRRPRACSPPPRTRPCRGRRQQVVAAHLRELGQRLGAAADGPVVHQPQIAVAVLGQQPVHLERVDQPPEQV